MAATTMIVVPGLPVSPLAPAFYLGRQADPWIDAPRLHWRPTAERVPVEQPTAAAS
jgi:hypothetical protein